jgi:5-formyltetrahydrofolate cyclo-ligase
MNDLTAQKRAARTAAQAARARASAEDAGAARRAAAHVLEAVAPHHWVRCVSGYLPIQSELDPRPAMLALAGLGFRVAVPEIVAPGAPLAFRGWTPEAATRRGPLGVEVPVEAEGVEPDLLLVPLLAFDRRGHRLGYGGGYYDRTIAGLRARRQVLALGFAHAAQELERVPDNDTDMRLDGIVTESGLIVPTP